MCHSLQNDESDFLGTVYADISKNKDKITEKDYLGKLLKYTSCNLMCRRYRYSTQNLVTGTDTHQKHIFGYRPVLEYRNGQKC